jgi:hypothetical protein
MTVRELELPDGRVASSCRACGAGGAYDPGISEQECGVCGLITCYSRCPRCKDVLVVPPDLTRSTVTKWKCLSCGRHAGRERWGVARLADLERTNAPLLNLYRRLGLVLADVESDPQRRRVDELILSASGTSVSGMAAERCTIFFDRAVAALLIGILSNPVPVPYEQMISLNVGGLGTVAAQSAGAWADGGFGFQGVFEGAFAAQILRYTPEALAAFLAPVVARIQSMHQAAE